MDRPRRDSRQHNGITVCGLSQPTFATKSANSGLLSLPRGRGTPLQNALQSHGFVPGDFDRAVGSAWTSAYDPQRPFGLGVAGNGEMSSVKSGRRGTKSPDPQRTNSLEPSQFGCRQLFAAFVANQRQTRKNLTRHRREAPIDQIYFGTEEI
jgi:hypothetical protein